MTSAAFVYGMPVELEKDRRSLPQKSRYWNSQVNYSTHLGVIPTCVRQSIRAKCAFSSSAPESTGSGLGYCSCFLQSVGSRSGYRPITWVGSTWKVNMNPQKGAQQFKDQIKQDHYYSKIISRQVFFFFKDLKKFFK